jgi:hypothetical protein
MEAMFPAPKAAAGVAQAISRRRGTKRSIVHSSWLVETVYFESVSQCAVEENGVCK